MAEITTHHGLLRDTHLHVDDDGGGARPVVLIHGWPLSSQSWFGQLDALRSAGYRVVTYDRRGFGRSDKPLTGYGYDTLADDLDHVLETFDVQDATLVGFSMGGGEVARYCARFGVGRLRSVVFASSVTPCLLKTGANPDGALTRAEATKMSASLAANDEAFYDEFMTKFFSAGGELKVDESEREAALAQCRTASKEAALACMAAFGMTDFRGDLAAVTVPTLVLHGTGDETVPFPASGARTAAAIPGALVHLIEGGPHGCNVSHAKEWNEVVVDFLGQ